MKLRFLATFELDDYKKHAIDKSENIFMVRYADAFKDKVRKEMRKLVIANQDRKAKGKEQVELDMNIDIHYAKRSIDQNSWLWLAHELEAKLINGNKCTNSQKIKWSSVDSVTSEMIHDDYMERYAPRGYIEVEPGFVYAVRKMIEQETGRVVKEETLPNGKIKFEIWKTSSYMNVAEFCELAEKIKQNILSYGIDLDSSIDYNKLIDDLETIKKEDEKGKVEPVKADPVKVVSDMFKGEVLTREDNSSTIAQEALSQPELEIY